MSKFFVAALLLVISAGLFFAFITPTYSDVQSLQAENGHLSEALDKSRELQSVRDTLRAKYNTFSSGDLDKLQKLVPDHIDNIRLILDVESIAKSHNITVNQFAFSGDGGTGPGSSSETAGGAYGSIIFQFSVTTDYDTFKAFMNDIEHSLRVIDIIALGIDPSDSGKNTYQVSIRTYWLK
jgi:Tfp pilus assembly protein PilO